MAWRGRTHHCIQPGTDALVNTMNTTTGMPSLLSLRYMFCRNRRGQRGVVAIEFALVFLFGLLPLLLLTFTGVLIFAAKQSLTLAAADGARAALHYNDAAGGGNSTSACNAALADMLWLVSLSNGSSGSTASTCTGSSFTNGTASISVAPDPNCTVTAPATCVKVTTSYLYDDHPFLPGTAAAYKWVMGKGKPITSTATIQIYNTQGS